MTAGLQPCASSTGDSRASPSARGPGSGRSFCIFPLRGGEVALVGEDSGTASKKRRRRKRNGLSVRCPHKDACPARGLLGRAGSALLRGWSALRFLCGPWRPSVNNEENLAHPTVRTQQKLAENRKGMSPPVFLLCLLLFAANASLRSFAASVQHRVGRNPIRWSGPRAASDPHPVRGCPRNKQKYADGAAFADCATGRVVSGGRHGDGVTLVRDVHVEGGVSDLGRSRSPIRIDSAGLVVPPGVLAPAVGITIRGAFDFRDFTQ